MNDLESISLRARTLNEPGIIFHSSNSLLGYFVTVYLNQGRLVVRFNLGESGELQSPVAVNDGEWHNIEVRFSTNRIEIQIDAAPTFREYSALVPLTDVIASAGSSFVFLAGSSIVNDDYFINYNHFDGCLDEVRVGGILLPFFNRETINSTSLDQFEAVITNIVYGCQGDQSLCNINHCMNFGTCVLGWNAFSCNCVPGFEGVNCEIDIDECFPAPCAVGSTCNNEVNNYTCACQLGYEGRNCSSEINECDPDPCLEGSACFDGLNFFNCTCLDGYTGTFCDVLVRC